MALAIVLSALPGPAAALDIKPQFDSSIAKLAQASQIETAFNRAAGVFEANFTDPATVNINVSWGKVNNHSLGSGTLGASWVNWWTAGSYSQTKAWLSSVALTAQDRTALANLPAKTPAGNRFEIPYAEAKALGLRAANASGPDGYVGFGLTPAKYTFNDSTGVATGTYDFLGIAEHEISEVLGRLSGFDTGGSPGYAYPFDLFRYAAPRTPTYGYRTAAYFSIDAGTTNLGKFNLGSGDKSDWVSASTSKDAQEAMLYPHIVLGLSTADLTALDVIGWDGLGTGTVIAKNGTGSSGGQGSAAVPAPPMLPTFCLTALGLGLYRRRDRKRQTSRHAGYREIIASLVQH
ncbi:MAG TPA: NF038122 family metalloprotease [Acetobacteraceae bacterium]|nr:NF038122 family metalloprotease [Acetobacteraceae bacterium]